MVSDPHTLLMHFDQEHRAHRDWPAPIVRGRDHKLAHEILETYSMEQAKALVSHFMVIEDDWIEKAGRGFNIFKSCLPKVLASYQRKCREDVVKNQAREQMQREIQQQQEWRAMTPEQRAEKMREDDDRARFGKRR